MNIVLTSLSTEIEDITIDWMLHIFYCHARYVLTVPFMYLQHIGQFLIAGAQSLQHTICPHGRKAIETSKSRHTLHNLCSFNCWFSSNIFSASEKKIHSRDICSWILG